MTEEKTETPLTMDDATASLGIAYTAWKEEEKRKNDRREKFFKLADEEVTERGLPTFTEKVYGPTQEEAEERAAKYFPHSEVLGMMGTPEDADEEVKVEEDYFKVLLRGLPEFQPFTYVNKEDGRIYKRTVSAGSLQLDDELLKELDPGLYERVTEPPFWFQDWAHHYKVDAGADAFSDVPRGLKNLDEIDGEDLAALGPFMYEGKPSVSLAAVRAAKPEELEDA